MAVKHTFITKDGHETKELTPIKAIRQKCLECCGWQFAEVSGCTAKDCALFPFKMGKTGIKKPWAKGVSKNQN